MEWPRTELCELFGIDHPILLAPMAGATTPTLVAAVSNAGGLGGHGCGVMAPDKLRDEINPWPFARRPTAPSRSTSLSMTCRNPMATPDLPGHAQKA